MLIEVFKSKIHRVTVTASDLNYIGSITVDEDLIDAAGLVVGERVYIVNVNNGERFDTYVIKGKRKSGEICLNGPAARKVQKGDVSNRKLFSQTKKPIFLLNRYSFGKSKKIIVS